MSFSGEPESFSASPPKFGRIARLRGFLPLNEDARPMATHGQGALTALIRSRSSASLKAIQGRQSSFRSREQPEDEEVGLGKSRRNSRGDDDSEVFRRNEERRLSMVLNGPQMRSQRLIGNSNPRYRWGRYWKTEDELKTMRKPMYVSP